MLQVVAARLWALLMEKKGLPSQIQVIRDVFLLGRGSIFQTLIEDNRETLLKVHAAHPAHTPIL